jgi:hypothetical protein
VLITGSTEGPGLLAARLLVGDRHDLTGFRCRSSEQTEWLPRYARQSASTGTTRVFVVNRLGPGTSTFT